VAANQQANGADPTWDVVVVGGGIAGLVTGCRAAELGLSVVVLEKGTEERYACNTRWTGGAFHFAFRDPTTGEERLRAAATEAGIDLERQPRAVRIIRNGERAIRWLQQNGARFIRSGQHEYQNWLLAPPRRQQPGPDWQGRGGDVMLNGLEARFLSHGGRLLRGTRAARLLVQNDRVTGVVAVRGGNEREFKARATVLADGGFQGSVELLGEYVTEAPSKVQLRNAGTGTGDGLRMAREAGAAVVGLAAQGTSFYGHVLSAEALENPMLTPFPFVDSLATCGISVDGAGKRFVDEGLGGVAVANAIARLDDPSSAIAIFDHAIWTGPAAERNIPPNPHLEKAGATIVSDRTIEGLAAKLGLPADHLARTVTEYNDAIAAKSGGSLTPPRSGRRVAPVAIASAPFYGVRLCAGVTYTMGGIAIDEASRVQRAGGGTVAGLYAAGCTTGGLEGGPDSIYLGGLLASSVAAMTAAEEIASELGR
jgi:fumarate reductase flavoprotein subunit